MFAWSTADTLGVTASAPWGQRSEAQEGTVTRAPCGVGALRSLAAVAARGGRDALHNQRGPLSQDKHGNAKAALPAMVGSFFYLKRILSTIILFSSFLYKAVLRYSIANISCSLSMVRK